MTTYCIYDYEHNYGIKRSETPLDNEEDHAFCHFHIDADEEQATELEHLIVDFKAARKKWDKVQDSLSFLAMLNHSGRLIG